MAAPAPTDLGIVLARMEVKLDTIIEKSGDHEARLRKLEEVQKQTAPIQGKNWQVVLANALLTAVNTALAGTMVVGG